MKNAKADVLRKIDVRPRLRPSHIRGLMGYPPHASISASVLQRIDEETARAVPWVHAAGMYRVFQVDFLNSRSVGLEGGLVFHGSIAEFMGKVERIAVFIATAGAEVYRRAQEELKEGRTLECLVVNAVGSEAAECATEEVEARIRSEAEAEGRAITLRYSPGYCGMDIREQAAVFAAIDGAEIGVKLLPSFIMSPVKSVSGIIGIGDPARIVSTGSPCERCDREDCMMRRYA